MSEHSPLPWRIENDNIVVDTNGEWVAPEDALSYQDAQMIVTAVNHHRVMINLLQMALARTDHEHDCKRWRYQYSDDCNCIVKQMQDVLESINQAENK